MYNEALRPMNKTKKITNVLLKVGKHVWKTADKRKCKKK
jgi:hypothetical protein